LVVSLFFFIAWKNKAVSLRMVKCFRVGPTYGLWVRCLLVTLLLFWVSLWSSVDSWRYCPEPAGGPGRGAPILPPLVLARYGLDLPVHLLSCPWGNCPAGGCWMCVLSGA
jgi:hypothetical protein